MPEIGIQLYRRILGRICATADAALHWLYAGECAMMLVVTKDDIEVFGK